MITTCPSTFGWADSVRWLNKLYYRAGVTESSSWVFFLFFSVFFFWGGDFLIYNIHLVFHYIWNISQQQTTRSYATGDPEQSRTSTMYTLLLFTYASASSAGTLFISSISSPLQSQADPSSRWAPGQGRAPPKGWMGERRWGTGGRPGSALPWGQRERRLSLLKGDETIRTTGARGTARGRLFLRWGGRWRGGWGRGHLFGVLPVLWCSWAWARSGTGTRGLGLGRGRAWSWSRSRSRTLGVVHVLSSRPRVRLPVGVVVLFGKKIRILLNNKVWKEY